MSGQSNKLRELLAMRGERFTPNDCPESANMTSCWRRYGASMARMEGPISNQFRAPPRPRTGERDAPSRMWRIGGRGSITE